MTKNEQIVRKGYEIAEKQDAEGFIGTFTPDGEFTNAQAHQPRRASSEICARLAGDR